MAGNVLFEKGREHFAQGDILWKAGGSTIKAILVDHGVDTPVTATDEKLADIAGGARVSTATMGTLTSTSGVCDAADLTFLTVVGASCESIVIYKDSGDENTSWLIAYIDTATGLPVTPNGGNITVTWDNGANKIFKL